MTSESPYQDKPSPWSSHSLIAAHLHQLPPGSKILDVGTASGMLARMCQHGAFRLFGVEPNPEWARLAAPLYEKIWVGYIDDIDSEALKDYQAVVLGDVLEHTVAPDKILQKLIALQHSGTHFVISVPNVANLWVRLNLLMGRFDYAERGILDRTHLRFFTRKTLIAMLKQSGLRVRSLKVTPIPLELVSTFFDSAPGQILHAAFARLTTAFPTVLGYQFIVEAEIP